MKTKSFEKFMEIIFLISASMSIVAIILICLFIFAGGIPFISEYGLSNFLFGTIWKPSLSPCGNASICPDHALFQPDCPGGH